MPGINETDQNDVLQGTDQADESHAFARDDVIRPAARQGWAL